MAKTWGGRISFDYSGSVETGTNIICGRGWKVNISHPINLYTLELLQISEFQLNEEIHDEKNKFRITILLEPIVTINEKIFHTTRLHHSRKVSRKKSCN
jgi:hypothetical protein